MPRLTIISSSYGNDSIALIQWVKENRPKAIVHVIYAETGWAANDWHLRVKKGENLARRYGFTTHTVKSKSGGFEEVVWKKRMFPMRGMQFCTTTLKTEPIMKLENELDPKCKARVLIGKRRAESLQRRTTPRFIYDDPYNGGRTIEHPIYRHSDEERDALIIRAGIAVLQHRSKECWPCINCNKADLLRLALDEERVLRVETLETKLGHTKKGKKKTMFRPRDHKGAQGIRESIIWAQGGDPRDIPNGDDDDLDCAYDSAGCGL